MSCCYLRFGFSGTKLLSSLLTVSLSELYYNLSTSQTCSFHVDSSAPPALRVSHLVLLFPFSSAKSILFLFPVKPKPMNCLPPLYFPSMPLLKSCLNSPAEVTFSCSSDHGNFPFLEVLPDFLSLVAAVTSFSFVSPLFQLRICSFFPNCPPNHFSFSVRHNQLPALYLQCSLKNQSWAKYNVLVLNPWERQRELCGAPVSLGLEKTPKKQALFPLEPTCKMLCTPHRCQPPSASADCC